MPPPNPPQTWTRQVSGTTYTVSTDRSLIQLDALNAAFASDMLYWAKPLAPDVLQLCVEQSLCFGLYAHGEGQEGSPQPQEGGDGGGADSIATKQGAEKTPPPPMVGFARLVTDHTTFAYLTDVYVLPPHQGRGLGRWMMGCLDETLEKWQDLRRCLLLTRDAAAVRMYGATIGAREMRQASSSGGLFVLERVGRGGVSFTGGSTEEADEGGAN
ncbi:N-acetyltransferase [Parachaetomium inaequale]|uniref:N-acetyltransferase n=1 Tax=Parachaetomium inaequale TaxID=2588326 RepID=A0AAN6STA3_9PEZI|nr:N-acetyltransferase [Parachaetomium inaequale]